MKLIKTIYFSFRNIFSTSQQDSKDTITQKEAGIYKEINEVSIKTRTIEKVLQNSINYLEIDYKECSEQVRTALIKDNEKDARFWLQKKSLIKDTLQNYKNLFFCIKDELAEIDNDIKVLNNAYSQLYKNCKSANKQIA
ncbi:MAG: hypothetical protein JM58_18500 [Peptococcaceae bacterium BICA1-8]|nr:MAG: hypothetical protein JM58_18500 [Peptococcaceae bacterium BICA1-8]